MDFLETLKFIGVCILVLVVLGVSFSLISSVIEFLNKKTKAISRYGDEMHRLDYNKELLSFIMTLTQLEVENEVKTLVSLNAQYNVANLDKDIEKIAKKVYASLKPEVYQADINMVNEDYIFQFIVEAASRHFLQTIRVINDSRLKPQ